MKQLFFILGFISLTFHSNAQISLENTFNLGTNTNMYWFETNSKGLMWLEDPQDTISNQVKIYNEDYSLYKVVTLPRPKGYNSYVHFMSEQLFNTNNLIEFICSYIYSKNPDIGVKIILYDENATVLKDFGTSYGDWWPLLINGNSGKSKLVLHRNSSALEVYSFSGSMPNYISELKVGNLQSAFPNPSKTTINLPYSLEKGQTSTMRIYKTNGQLIDLKQIGSAFDKIILNVDSYQSGTYIYEYNGISKKFIVN